MLRPTPRRTLSPYYYTIVILALGFNRDAPYQLDLDLVRRGQR